VTVGINNERAPANFIFKADYSANFVTSFRRVIENPSSIRVSREGLSLYDTDCGQRTRLGFGVCDLADATGSKNKVLAGEPSRVVRSKEYSDRGDVADFTGAGEQGLLI